MKISKIQTKKIKEYLKKFLWFLAEKAFLTYLVLLFVALIFGVTVYYQSGTMAEKVETETAKEPLQFQQKTYQDILKIWQDRENKLKEAGLKEFPDLSEVEQEEGVLEESFDSSENDQEEDSPEELEDFSGVDQE